MKRFLARVAHFSIRNGLAVGAFLLARNTVDTMNAIVVSGLALAALYGYGYLVGRVKAEQLVERVRAEREAEL